MVLTRKDVCQALGNKMCISSMLEDEKCIGSMGKDVTAGKGKLRLPLLRGK